MPAGGERPGAWAPGPAFGHLTDRGMKPYSPWPQRQEEGRTVLGRSRTLLLDCCVGLPGGRDEVGCTGLGVRRDVLCGERVSWKGFCHQRPLPSTGSWRAAVLGQVEGRLLAGPAHFPSGGLEVGVWALGAWVRLCRLCSEGKKGKRTFRWLFSVGVHL